MAGTRGSEVPLLDEVTRRANIADNERRVRALIEIKRSEALGGNKNPTEKAGLSQQPKTRKKPNNCTSEVANGGRNLRSQSRINHDVEDPNNEPLGHGSNDIQDEELMERRDTRIKKEDWIKLIDQWRKRESEASSARNKQNRSNLKLLHVAGSKSFAHVGHDMIKPCSKPPLSSSQSSGTNGRK